ncbi:MAG: hypothetical protein DWI21_19050 [Planctomycetota bacterium]|nr:MAG: hypothetical protein DWI21_19050 [Planctomycetota bacterium]
MFELCYCRGLGAEGRWITLKVFPKTTFASGFKTGNGDTVHPLDSMVTADVWNSFRGRALASTLGERRAYFGRPFARGLRFARLKRSSGRLRSTPSRRPRISVKFATMR